MGEITLTEMLEARERRARRQQALLREGGSALICFTMNIAGPVKNSELIRQGFRYGQRLLEEQLEDAGLPVLRSEVYWEDTGNEAFYLLEAAPEVVKGLMVEIEDGSPVGRLFDMDVLAPTGEKVDRSALGLPERRCLVCGGPAKACASRRVHPVEALQAKTRALLEGTFRQLPAELAAQLACRSLLYEVCTTPKPGLVDLENSGSHLDMDIFTFMASVPALEFYFKQCVEIGQETADLPPTETLRRLRWPGKRAERAMKRATGGVNTHKGAIFSMGILCGALGRLPRAAWGTPAAVLAMCREMAAGIAERELPAAAGRTAGERLYRQYGITGARGQAEAGFPAVGEVGLPMLRAGLAQGLSLHEAGRAVLLALITVSNDTNLAARGGRAVQLEVVEQLSALLRETPFPDRAVLTALDRSFIQAGLSPGGSADLLALTYFLHFLGEIGDNDQ